MCNMGKMRRAVSRVVYDYILVSTPSLRLSCDRCFNHSDRDAITNTFWSPEEKPTHTTLNIHEARCEYLAGSFPYVCRWRHEKDFLQAPFSPLAPTSLLITSFILSLEAEGGMGRWSSRGVSAFYVRCFPENVLRHWCCFLHR